MQAELRQACSWVTIASMKRKMAKRSLSRINFQSQHWWTKHLTARTMSIDEEKAALIYEAMRRRKEIQNAWVKGTLSVGDGCQDFTHWVIQNLPKSWVDLDEMTRNAIVKTMHLPWFVPPRGYSTFPDKFMRAECRKAAMQVLRLPSSDNQAAAQEFVRHAQKFADAGFEIVAVDNKTKQAVRYACKAIESLPRSVRKADLKEERIAYLPEEVSDADRQAVEEKHRQGTFTNSDLTKLWRKYPQNLTSRNSPLNVIKEVHSTVQNKRMRGKSVVEEKLFSFSEICRELERVDSGLATKGDFLQRVRL